MIINKTGNDVESIGAAPLRQASGTISHKNIAKIIGIVTTQLYSNPIGSLIRELISNCYDAHIKFQKNEKVRLDDPYYEYNEPVVLQYTEEEGQGFVSFIDYGTGLSPRQMDEIYINIGESDKENDNDALGYYGLGSKSFLSYTHSADVTTIQGGIKYNYLLYRSNEGLLTYDLLRQSETDEHSGTTVKLCIGAVIHQDLGYVSDFEDNVSLGNYKNKAQDFLKFRKEIQSQLHYFENLYIQGFDLENNYNLYEADTFKVRSGFNPFKEMHIVLGKVAYPINWYVLNREPIKVPVGIIFNIGELNVPPSRENISYEGDGTIEFINSKIDNCLKEIVKRYNATATQVDDLSEYLRFKKSPNKILKIQDVEIALPKKQSLNKKQDNYVLVDEIEGLLDMKWTPLAHLPIDVPDDPFFIFRLQCQLVSKGKKGEIDTGTPSYNNLFSYLQNKRHIYRLKDDRNKLIDAYLIWLADTEVLPEEYELKKQKPLVIKIKTNSFKSYCDELGLDENKVTKKTSVDVLLGRKKIASPLHEIKDGKNLYVSKFQIIKEYKKVITKLFVGMSKSYEKQELSPEYLSYLQIEKLANKKPKLEGAITVYDLVQSSSSISSILDLESLEKYSGMIIYGEREKLELLQNIKQALSNTKYSRTPHKYVIKFYKKVLYKSPHLYRGKIMVNEYQYIEHGGKVVSRINTYGNLRTEVCKILVVAKSNQKYLGNNPHFMHVDEFISNNNRVFRNIVTAWYIHKELNLINDAVPNLYANLNTFNSKLEAVGKELVTFVDKNYYQRYNIDEFMETLYQVGIEKNMLWDDKIQELNLIKDWFSGDMTIFKYIEEEAFTESIPDIAKLLKSKHKRLNSEHYFIPTEEEINLITEAKEEIEYREGLKLVG